jgi:hypothetical protein
MLGGGDDHEENDQARQGQREEHAGSHASTLAATGRGRDRSARVYAQWRIAGNSKAPQKWRRLMEVFPF